MATLIFALVFVAGALVFWGVVATGLSCPLCLLAATHSCWLVVILSMGGLETLGDESTFYVYFRVFVVIDLVMLRSGSLG